MLQFVAIVLLLAAAATGETIHTSTARISSASARFLMNLCLSQGNTSSGETWGLSEVGPHTHQYITLTDDSITMKFIHEDWAYGSGNKVAISQMIVHVMPDGRVARVDCNQLLETKNGDVLNSTSSTCPDQLVQKRLDSMTAHFIGSASKRAR